MIWIFSISSFALMVAAFVFVVAAIIFYQQLATVVTSVIEIMPILTDVVLVAVLIGAIIYGVLRKRVLSGVLFALSWSQCMLIVMITIEAVLSIIPAAGNLFMLLLLGPVGAIAACIPAGIDLIITIKGWCSGKEVSVWIGTAITWGLILLLVFLQ